MKSIQNAACEDDIQRFIAANPWLLDLNYEAVPELQGTELEHQLGDQKRADLILRETTSGRPVVVEFKFTPFYRENIGQLLEYRARVATSFTRENARLYEVFTDFTLVPKLALVVQECDDFSRIACNMSGIDVYEYRNFSRKLADPGFIKRVESLKDVLASDPLPIKPERAAEIKKQVYDPMQRIIEAKGLEFDGRNAKNSDVFATYNYIDLFINRWWLQSEKPSITVCEDVFGDFAIVLSYYDTSQKRLARCAEIYQDLYGDSPGVNWSSDYGEGSIDFRFSRETFLNDVEGSFRRFFECYLEVRGRIANEAQSSS